MVRCLALAAPQTLRSRFAADRFGCDDRIAMLLDPPQGFAQDCNGHVFGDERYDALGRPGVAGGLIGRFQRQRIDQWRIVQLFSLTIKVFDHEQIVRDCGS